MPPNWLPIALSVVALLVAFVGGALGVAAAFKAGQIAPDTSQFLRRADVADLSATITSLRTEWSAVCENIDTQLETVERKRRQTAASAARAGQMHEPEPAQMSREDLLSEARRRSRGA